MASINRPSEVVMFIDLHSNYANYATPFGIYASWKGYNIGDKNYVPHFDGANVAFADGHVKWMKQTDPFAKSTQPNCYWDFTNASCAQ